MFRKTALPIDVAVFKCPKFFSDGKYGRNRALFTSQKNSTFSQTVAKCADRAQNLPWSAPNIWLTMFQI